MPRYQRVLQKYQKERIAKYFFFYATFLRIGQIVGRFSLLCFFFFTVELFSRGVDGAVDIVVEDFVVMQMDCVHDGLKRVYP